MKALITGASSGIGKEMAIYLANMGYDLVLVSRNCNKLNDVKKIIKTNVTICRYDLAIEDNCYKLYDDLKSEKIDVIINNAGCGVYGDYSQNNLGSEINLINLNIKAIHILTKLFVNNTNTKYILNVASTAGLVCGGPLMATYYATKSYVCSYSFSVYEELRRNKSKKHISVLCPGPVNTNFNNNLNIKFGSKAMNAVDVSKYAIDNMFKNKLLIIPGFKNKLGVFVSGIIPRKLFLKINYNIQKKKR